MGFNSLFSFGFTLLVVLISVQKIHSRYAEEILTIGPNDTQPFQFYQYDLSFSHSYQPDSIVADTFLFPRSFLDNLIIESNLTFAHVEMSLGVFDRNIFLPFEGKHSFPNPGTLVILNQQAKYREAIFTLCEILGFSRSYLLDHYAIIESSN